MVRGDSIIQYWQAITFLRFKKPLKPSSPILCKLEQKLSLMTPVGDMPYLPRDIMSFALAIASIFYIDHFSPKKGDIGPNLGCILEALLHYFNILLRPDPLY